MSPLYLFLPQWMAHHDELMEHRLAAWHYDMQYHQAHCPGMTALDY